MLVVFYLLVVKCPAIPNTTSKYWLNPLPISTYGTVRYIDCIPGTKVCLGCNHTRVPATCNSLGYWDYKKSCVRIRCPPFKAAYTNATGAVHPFGTTMTVACKELYHLETGNKTYTTSCLATGKWSLEITCIKTFCPVREVPDSNATNINVAAAITVVIQCNVGYVISGSISAYAVSCLPNGHWSGQFFTCKPVPCPAIVVAHSDTTNTSNVWTKGDTLNIVCDEGYGLTDGRQSYQTVCNNSGMWSINQSCNPIVCGQLVHGTTVKPTEPIAASAGYGYRVDFVCTDGYTNMEGDNYADCMENGTWSPLPFCLEECDPIGEILGGGKSTDNVQPGTEVRISCNEGYIAQGSTLLTCTNKGTWDNKPADCARSPVDGYWLEWYQWTSCPVTCSFGKRTRKRTCLPPKYGGLPCPGTGRQEKECGLPCPVDAVLGEWSTMGPCSASCGLAFQTKQRNCTEAIGGGKPCPTGKRALIQAAGCRLKECPTVYQKLTKLKLTGEGTDDSNSMNHSAMILSIIFLFFFFAFVAGMDIIGYLMRMEKPDCPLKRLYAQ